MQVMLNSGSLHREGYDGVGEKILKVVEKGSTEQAVWVDHLSMEKGL